jgi:hypothetical protein
VAWDRNGAVALAAVAPFGQVAFGYAGTVTFASDD